MATITDLRNGFTVVDTEKKKLEVGTILAKSWGYSMTIVQYYVVVRRTHVTAWVREIQKNIVDDNWDLIIAHPPCTHLSVSGASRWAEKVADGRQPAAIKFVEAIWAADCPKICIENPVGALSSRSKLGKATQYVQPYEFGHAEQKKTGFWLKGLPKLKGTDFIDVSGLPDRERQRLHWLPPSKDRWKLRSTTFQGIADAMADQWG